MFDFYHLALTQEGKSKNTFEFQVTLVDDDPLFLASLSDYLESMGLPEPEKFSSGEALLSALKPDDSRFIICDYDFGSSDRMTGLQVLEELRRRSPKTPVVILSSQDKLDVALKTLRAGAVDYFIKGNESTFTTVLTSILKSNEIFRLKKDRKDLMVLATIGAIVFSLLLAVSFLYR
ncbi:MAG: response regulator [Bacteroidota bacterium]